eukprot:g8862.t1
MLINTVQTYFQSTQGWPADRGWVIRLVGQEFWLTGDAFEVLANKEDPAETDLDDHFKKWKNYKNTPGVIPMDYDCAHLLSHRDFAGSVVGYSTTGAICSNTLCTGMDQTNFRNGLPSAVASIIAHELGHNLGMRHDGGAFAAGCPASEHIMSAIINSAGPAFDTFSSCSIASYDATYVQNNRNCMAKSQSKGGAWTFGADCGNGVIDSASNEECDCGSLSADDPCCHCADCKLKPGAECSGQQPCCVFDTCKFQPAAVVCRPARSSCDIEERCDGRSGDCVADLYVGAGNPCSDSVYGPGTCYAGLCISPKFNCRPAVTGRDGMTGCDVQKTIEQNGGSYCMALLCTSGGSTCNNFSDPSGGGVLVMPDGTPCGNGDNCLDGTCVSPEMLNAGYSWQVGDWYDCSNCAAQQLRPVYCIERTYQGVVSTVNEYRCSITSKPKASRQCFNLDKGGNCNGLTTDPTTQASRELARKYGAQEKARRLLKLIQGKRVFTFDRQDPYWDSIGRLILPGMVLAFLFFLLLAVFLLLQLLDHYSPEKNRTKQFQKLVDEGLGIEHRRYSWDDVRRPYYCMVFFLILSCVFVALALFANTEVQYGLTSSGGVTVLVEDFYQEAKSIVVSLKLPLDFLNSSALPDDILSKLSVTLGLISPGLSPLTTAVTAAHTQAGAAAAFSVTESSVATLEVDCAKCGDQANQLQNINSSVSNGAGPIVQATSRSIRDVLSQTVDLNKELNPPDGAMLDTLRKVNVLNSWLQDNKQVLDEHTTFVTDAESFRGAFNAFVLVLVMLALLMGLYAGLVSSKQHFLRHVAAVLATCIVLLWRFHITHIH